MSSASDMERERRSLLDEIARLTPTSVDVEDDKPLRTLKQRYNAIVDAIDAQIRTRKCDIINVFPPEIWTQIILEVLLDRSYPQALLDLTMVSQTWMLALTSVPALWAYIDICALDPDLAATTETFRALSLGSPISLIVRAPLFPLDEIFDSCVATLGSTVKSITIVPSPNGQTAYVQDTLALTQKFMDSWGLFPKAKDIYIRSTFSIFTTEPGCWAFLPGSQSMDYAFSSIGLKDGQQSFHSAFPSSVVKLKVDVSHSSASDITRGMHHLEELVFDSSGEFREDPKESLSYSHLSALKRLIYLDYSPSAIPFLKGLIGRLEYLHVGMPCSEASSIIPILQKGNRLDHFELQLYTSSTRTYPSYDEINRASHVSLAPLRMLRSFRLQQGADEFYSPVGDEDIAWVKDFIQRSVIMLLQVVELKISVQVASSCGIPYLLSNLNNLRHLRLWTGKSETVRWAASMTRIDTLEVLEIVNGVRLVDFHAPNITRLEIGWSELPNRHSPSATSNVRLLVLHCRGSSDRFEIIPSHFPLLADLDLRFEEGGTFVLTQLHHLTRVTIKGAHLSHHATALCMSLLYEPESCCSLEQLDFRNQPEWDALFAMLRRRNFLRNERISKIRTVGLPWIPNSLRTPLSSLLNGRHTEHLSLKQLSRAVERSVLLDQRMYVLRKAPLTLSNVSSNGCSACLHNLFSCHDLATHMPYQLSLFVDMYSLSGNPPPASLDLWLKNWLTWREGEIESRRVFTEEGVYDFRPSFCERWTKDGGLTVTADECVE